MLRVARAVGRVAVVSVRSMGAAAPVAHAPKVEVKVPDGVTIPKTVDTLEWLLDTPPNLHEFEEAPIVVEIEHLDALIPHDD